ncbi:MAG: nucleotidyltransferase domain-containing protein [Candidatus Aenigmarchaeota archaeon]|nr:nucleotidyltransferase domain-containing protein [Candidatus Aenigmarchaeota archaeon]
MVKFFELLSSRTLGKILDVMLENSNKEYSLREIIKKSKVSKITALNNLKKLSKMDVVEKIRKNDGRVFFKIKNNSLTHELKLLWIVSQLYPFFKNVDYEVYLFGSYANGDYDENSDIDLLIFQRRTKEIIRTIRRIENKLKKRVNAIFYTPIEWMKVKKVNPGFFEMVERSKVRIS